MSLDAADISYISAGKSADGEHDIVLAVLETKQGLLYDEKRFIDTSFYRVESVTVDVDGVGSHTSYLGRDEKLTDLMHTFAFNLPEVCDAADAMFTQAVQAKAEQGKDAGDYATVRWIGHSAAYRIARGLTMFDEENETIFELTAARTREYPLTFMVTMRSDGQKGTATVDLMQFLSQVYGSPSAEQKQGFQISQGLFASDLEAAALGDEGVGFMKAWAALPDDASIYVIPTEWLTAAAASFAQKGAPTLLVDRMKADGKKSGRKLFITPNAPSVVNGQTHWYWLEIDETNWNTRAVSMCETGERAAALDYIILNAASFGVKPLSAEGVAGCLYGITCINWGIATFSLETENYKVILAKTKAFVGLIGDMLATIELSGGIAGAAGTGNIEGLAEGALEAVGENNKLGVNLSDSRR